MQVSHVNRTWITWLKFQREQIWILKSTLPSVLRSPVPNRNRNASGDHIESTDTEAGYETAVEGAETDAGMTTENEMFFSADEEVSTQIKAW